MQHDRMPRHPVTVDEDAHAEEMDVAISLAELSRITDVDLSRCRAVEPWLRVRHADDLLVSFGSTVIYTDEEDGA